MHDPWVPFGSLFLAAAPFIVRSYQATTCITDFSSIIRTLLVTSADGRQGWVSWNMMAAHDCTNLKRWNFPCIPQSANFDLFESVLLFCVSSLFAICFSLSELSYAFHRAGLCHRSEQQHSHADHAPRLEARCGDACCLSNVSGEDWSRKQDRDEIIDQGGNLMLLISNAMMVFCWDIQGACRVGAVMKNHVKEGLSHSISIATSRKASCHKEVGSFSQKHFYTFLLQDMSEKCRYPQMFCSSASK